MNWQDLLTRSIEEYGNPPTIGHAVPLFHVKLDDGKHWLPARPHTIGGSEAADALGVGYNTQRQLARRKLGREPEFAGNYQTRRGSWMEDFALAEFELQTGLSVERVPWVLRHPEYEWMSCNLDAVIDGTHVGEVKCPGDYVMPDLERLRQGLPVAPMSAAGRYVIQIHHCMEVTGLSSAWLIVLPGTRDPVFVELERNDALCSAIVKAESDLWALISQGIEPPPRAGDLRDMAKAWRAEHMGEQETADERLVEMFEELDAIRENRRECEAAAKEYKALEDEHVARMGEIAATAGAQKLRVICPDKTRSITVVQSRPGLDGKALAKAHPDIHAEFSTKARAPYFKVS